MIAVVFRGIMGMLAGVYAALELAALVRWFFIAALVSWDISVFERPFISIGSMNALAT